MQANLNNTSLEEATGTIPYNMTNDYMFRAVLQKNKTVLRGLVGALLHINPELLDVEITNPIELGQSYQNKEFMLDINVIVNGQTRLNLEMQVINYQNWKERSLSYLCRSFDNVFKGHDYMSNRRLSQVISADYLRRKHLSHSAVNDADAHYIGWHRRLSRAYFSSAMAGLK